MDRFPHFFTYHPDPVENVAVVDRTPAQPEAPLPARLDLKVLCWNVQFCASRAYHFFYDGGRDVFAEPRVVIQTMERIVHELQRLDADIVMLQELDRGADRTGGIDQLAYLVERLGYRYWVACPYHQARYVPKPWYRPLGKVNLWMAIFSKLPLKNARRIQLPLLQEPPLVQRFNLKRALLSAELPGSRLHLGCTHLSAFSNGDGTVTRQVAALLDWAQSCQQPWLLGGDFNALPPQDDAQRLREGAAEYLQNQATEPALAPLLRWSVVPEPELLHPTQRSYLPVNSPIPDRKLDYFFASGLKISHATVCTVATDLSDHLPLWAGVQESDRPLPS